MRRGKGEGRGEEGKGRDIARLSLSISSRISGLCGDHDRLLMSREGERKEKEGKIFLSSWFLSSALLRQLSSHPEKESRPRAGAIRQIREHQFERCRGGSRRRRGGGEGGERKEKKGGSRYLIYLAGESRQLPLRSMRAPPR